MGVKNPLPTLGVGSELVGPTRMMTLERVRWFEESGRWAGDASVKKVHANFHTDQASAEAQGLKAPIADGQLTAQWCSSLLLSYFGWDYIERGELRTKFIKPTYLDVPVTVRGVVTTVEKIAEGELYCIDIWSEDNQGTKLTVGEGRVEVRR